MVGQSKPSNLGFKELVIWEQIADVCGRTELAMGDNTPVEKVGLTPEKIGKVIKQIEGVLLQDAVSSVNPEKIKTLGDVLFCFYAPAERYKYFERLILSGLHQSGNFIKGSIEPNEELEKNVLRTPEETEAVFARIQYTTGRDYRLAYQIALKKGEMKVGRDLMDLLSQPQNGVVVRSSKKRPTTLLGRMFGRQNEG